MTNMKCKCFFQGHSLPTVISIALLIVRIVMGIAFMQHGWFKIQNPFSWMGADAAVPGVLQLLAALSEFGGGFALIIGLFSSLASFGIACTMMVAIFTHAVIKGDPFVGGYELAVVYLSLSILFILTGPGKFSLDYKLFGNRACSK